MSLTIFTIALTAVTTLLYHFCWNLFWSPLAKIPGPRAFAVTKWVLAYNEYVGVRTRKIHQLHQMYGPVVRIGPNEVSFNSQTALRQIYGPGTGFGRPRPFYRLFDIYGQPHMFTVFSSSEHAARKKVLSQLYSKSAILKTSAAESIQRRVTQFLELIEVQRRTLTDLSRSLHYFSLDNITTVVFGSSGGATESMAGCNSDRLILSDIDQHTARRHFWFQLHLPHYSQLAMSCGSRLASVLDTLGAMPGMKPLAYSGLQQYAMQTFSKHRDEEIDASTDGDCLMARLLRADGGNLRRDTLSDAGIAAECADHLDAGLKTTSDTLMFTLWALSLPCNQDYQQRLRSEVCSAREKLPPEDTSSVNLPLSVKTSDTLPFLDAVVKEALRLYAPIPASQPRVSSNDTIIDGYPIPASTVVSCQAYSLHRNSEVFQHPSIFNPDRWISASDEEIASMRRWWWPFSSGGRMCLGMQ